MTRIDGYPFRSPRTETFNINYIAIYGFKHVLDCIIRKSLNMTSDYIIQTKSILKEKIEHVKNVYDKKNNSLLIISNANNFYAMFQQNDS